MLLNCQPVLGQLLPDPLQPLRVGLGLVAVGQGEDVRLCQADLVGLHHGGRHPRVECVAQASDVIEGKLATLPDCTNLSYLAA